jgi:hypothetical protein
VAVHWSVPRLLPLASIAPVIPSRPPAANSISIDLQVPEGAVKVCCSGATESRCIMDFVVLLGRRPRPKGSRECLPPLNGE